MESYGLSEGGVGDPRPARSAPVSRPRRVVDRRSPLPRISPAGPAASRTYVSATGPPPYAVLHTVAGRAVLVRL